MKQYAVMVLVFLFLDVLCWTSFAWDICMSCYGTGKEICTICHGSGICSTCKGKGIVGYLPDHTGRGKGYHVPCVACDGTRKCWRCEGNRITRCHTCAGTGMRNL